MAPALPAARPSIESAATIERSVTSLRIVASASRTPGVRGIIAFGACWQPQTRPIRAIAISEARTDLGPNRIYDSLAVVVYSYAATSLRVLHGDVMTRIGRSSARS